MVETWRERHPELRGFTRYEDLLAADACDAVLLATPMGLHARQAGEALRAGRHVLSEVIAATTLDECWALVEAAERSPAVYMLAENYCYMRPNMMVRHLVERGVFGSVYYAEGAYVHDCRPLLFDAAGQLTWRAELARGAPGNSYPTHSLGPVAQWLGCSGAGAGDRLADVVCLTTPDLARRPTSCSASAPTIRRPHPALPPRRLGLHPDPHRAGGRGLPAHGLLFPRPHNMTHYLLQGTTASYLSARH